MDTEKIKKFLKSLEEGSVILGAKLLTTIERKEEQVEVFKDCCNEPINDTNFVSDAAILQWRIKKLVINISPLPGDPDYWVAVTGSDWTIFFVPNNRAYLVTNEWKPPISDKYIKRIIL